VSWDGANLMAIYEQSLNLSIDVGSNKFKNLEKLTNPQREELVGEYNRVSKKVTQVKVKDNNFVFFHEQDSIFQLADEISKDECDTTSTSCNNCIKQ
jgi:hypothetical protein